MEPFTHSSTAKKLRVVMVTPDPEGGIYHYSIELCNSLVSQNIEPVLATSRGHEFADAEHNFEVAEPFSFRRHRFFDNRLVRRLRIRKIFNAIRYLLSLFEALCIIRRYQPNLIHVQGLFGSVLGLVTLTCLRALSRRPIVDTVHNLAPRRSYPFQELVAKLSLSCIDHVIVHSAYGKAQFLERHFISRQRITVIPHGNYLSFSRGAQAELQHPQAARLSLRIPTDARVILFFGYIKPYKGLHVLIEAFKNIRNQVSGAHLLIAGKPIEDFARYRQVLAEHHLFQHVTIHLGYIAPEDVPIYFAASDVVALPYVADSHESVPVDQSGIVQLAYAFRKPVVLSSIGGLQEVVEEGKSGYYVRPGSSDELARKLVMLLQDKDALTTMGEHSYSLAKGRFSWESIGKKHREAYCLVL